MNWKKIILWGAAVVMVLVAGVAISAILLVKESPSFRQGLVARVERNIYESTGARVEVRDFSLGFFPLNLDLYGVVVHGTEPQFGQPWLRADHVGAGVNVGSLAGRKWSLRDVVIDGPVAHFFVNQSGESNLPQPEKSTRSTAHFDLGIRQLQLHGGEVYWNDKKILADAELRNLRSTVVFDGNMKRYHVVLRYANGTIKYGDYAPVVHNLDLTFDTAAAKFAVDHLALVAGKSRVALTGSVEDYNHPVVQASYDAQLATGELAAILKNSSIPTGLVHLTGSLNYRCDPGRPVLEAVSLIGTISSSALAVATPGLHAEVSDFGAKYKLAGGNAEVENIHAQVFAGKMTGSLSVHDLAGASTAKLQARLKDVSLEQLQSSQRQASSPEAQLSGRINADVEATWNKTLKDLEAHGNATLAGTLGRRPATSLRAAFHADYVAASQQMALRQTFIRTPQTFITLDGKVSEQSALQVSLRSGNLHELELLAGDFRSATSGHAAPSLDLYGTASFSGTVSGSAGAPQLKGQLEARDLRVKGTSWKLLRTDIDASPSSLSFSNGSLEAGRAPERLQRPEPEAATTSRSEGQISQPRDAATVK